MPENVIVDKVKDYTGSIPSFLAPKMPAELSNAPKEAPKPEAKTEAPAAPPAKEEAKAESAPATPPQTEGEVKEPEDTEKETTGKDPEKQSSRRFERRIDRATRRAAEAEARAEAAIRRATELEAKLQQPKPVEGAPRMEDFTDIQEYAKAYANFEKGNAIKEYETRQRQQQQQAQLGRIQSEWTTRAEEASDRYEDFDEVVGTIKPVNALSVAVMQAGPDVAYSLAKNPKEVQRLLALDPLTQIREIGKLEAKLAQQPAPKKTPSQAPKPIAPVTGAAETGEPSLTDQMPFEKYLSVRDKVFRKR